MNARKPESKNFWRLHVENFGRINSADIDIAPMLIFVGPNNTGKSYLTSLLWGLLELKTEVFPEKPIDNSQYYSLRNLWISHCRNKEEWFSNDLIQAAVQYYNTVLEEKKNGILREIFTFDGLEIGKLAVSVQYNIDIKDHLPFAHPDEDSPNFETEIYQSLIWLINEVLFDKLDAPYYLPASRTGFMLSYRSLTKGLMDTWGLEKKAKIDFPLPIIRFLQKLIEADIRKGKAVEVFLESKLPGIAKALEKEILEGEIRQYPDPIPTFYYQAEKMEDPLPLHVTSSLVSELSPLIIFLKAKTDIHTPLIFEEPESHLHLGAQRKLAKHLVKLVNSGLPIWLTTHSDTFFQQINHLIASDASRLAKLRDIGYSDDETIHPDDIRAYQFNSDKKSGMTEVVTLEQTDDGFVAPTFNWEIYALSRESMALESD